MVEAQWRSDNLNQSEKEVAEAVGGQLGCVDAALGGGATEKMRRRSMGLEGKDGQQRRERGRQQKGAGKQRQNRWKWYVLGFNTDHGTVAWCW